MTLMISSTDSRTLVITSRGLRTARGHILLPRCELQGIDIEVSSCMALSAEVNSCMALTGAGVLQLLDVPLGDGHAGKELLHMDAMAASVGICPGAGRRAMRWPCRSWRSIASSSASLCHLLEDLSRDALNRLGGRLLGARREVRVRGGGWRYGGLVDHLVDELVEAVDFQRHGHRARVQVLVAPLHDPEALRQVELVRGDVLAEVVVEILERHQLLLDGRGEPVDALSEDRHFRQRLLVGAPELLLGRDVVDELGQLVLVGLGVQEVQLLAERVLERGDVLRMARDAPVALIHALPNVSDSPDDEGTELVRRIPLGRRRGSGAGAFRRLYRLRGDALPLCRRRALQRNVWSCCLSSLSRRRLRSVAEQGREGVVLHGR